MTKILIVDDEAVCRESSSALLACHGFDVRAAADGAEAVRIGKSFRPDLLVVDYMLGGDIDGIDVAKTLGAANPNMQTIVVTGFAAADLEARMKEEPSMRLFTKPVPADELIQAARDADGQTE